MPAVSAAPPRAAAAVRELGAARLSAYLFAHAVLGVVAHLSPAVTTVHAYAVLGAAMLMAVAGRTVHVLILAGYVTGAEVLWRMADARVPWDTGKYFIPVFLLCAGSRLHTRARFGLPAYLYFVLLLPSLLLTLFELSGRTARVQTTFYLAGPLALAVSVWFFSKLEIDEALLRRIFLAAIGPIVSVAAIAVYSTVTAERVQFRSGSNFTTSGGFGPNQVSSTLGLGALLATLMVLSMPLRMRVKGVLVATITVLVGQGLLTFSRGGIWGAAIPAVVAALYLTRDPRVRVQVLGASLVFGALLAFVLLPRLDSLTGGELADRFSDRSTTHRAEFAQLDLQIWQNHPLLGIGPGMGKAERTEAGFVDFASHTEYTRLLAEHGMFGLAALALMFGIGTVRLMRAEPGADRALVIAMLGWAALYLAHAGMRTVAPSLIFGLATARFTGFGARPGVPRPEAPPPLRGVSRTLSPLVAGSSPGRGR